MKRPRATTAHAGHPAPRGWIDGHHLEHVFFGWASLSLLWRRQRLLRVLEGCRRPLSGGPRRARARARLTLAHVPWISAHTQVGLMSRDRVRSLTGVESPARGAEAQLTSRRALAPRASARAWSQQLQRGAIVVLHRGARGRQRGRPSARQRHDLGARGGRCGRSRPRRAGSRPAAGRRGAAAPHRQLRGRPVI